MIQPIRDAIAAHYVSFTAPQPRAVQGCTCCTAPKELAALVAVPREALAPAALEFYAHKALTTVGTVENFRYYWPRVAELAIAGEFLTDIEVVFDKPRYGAHHTWPAEEREVLVQLAAALGARFAAEELEPDEVDAWVCAIGLLSAGLVDPREPLEPLLTDTPAARANLRAFIDWNEEDLREKKQLGNPYWENASETATLLAEWLISEPRAVEAARALAWESAAKYGTPPPAY